MEKIYVTSEASQVELVNSPALWECLQIIKTDPEFRDLSYRATKDVNDQECLIIYRDRVIRVFALPVEPISMTIEATGRCLLSIPFKPAHLVTITKPSTGEVDRPSLKAVLRMVSGKGYSFCPGIQEKFLLGKTCGKYVIMNRIPFKRYNAQGCPVYFQCPSVKTNSGKPHVRAICPRCLQVTRWLQTLPSIRGLTPTASMQSKAVTAKMPLTDSTKLQNARNETHQVDSLSNDCVIVGVEKAEMVPKAMHPQRALPTVLASATGRSAKIQQSSSVSEEMVTNEQAISRSKEMDVKLQSVSESLRQLLKARSLGKETGSLPVDGNYKLADSASKASRGKNVCKLCQKQFSSNLRLSRHVQRHEGTRRNLKVAQWRKTSVLNSSDAIIWRALRGCRSQAKNGRKRHGDISLTSLRLLLKSLDAMMDETVSEQSYHDNEPHRKRKRRKSSTQQDSDVTDYEKPEIGLSALLVAAAGIADQQEVYSSSSSIPYIVDRELSNDGVSSRDEDLLGSQKKARKSLRLASKKAKVTPKKISTLKEKMSEESTLHNNTIDDSLTNLNLLSTVSLQVQAAPVAVLKPMINSAAAGSSSTSRISRTSTLPLSTSALESNVPPQQTRRSLSTKLVSSHPAEVTGVSSGAGRGNIPVLPCVRQELLSSSLSKLGAPFSKLGSFPSVSPSAYKVVPGHKDHNIPLPVLDKEMLASTTPSETSQAGSPERPASEKSDCGAMDLSKRKVLSCQVLGVRSRENPSPSTQRNKNTAEAIRRLLMINPDIAAEPVMAGVSKDLPSPRALTSNKEADENLQARIFASAKNYKVESAKQSSGQVQTVVAPFATSVSNPKQSNAPSSEIHCGYKWSGSGGLVKERTQMVKELVPTLFMRNILSKPAATSSGQGEEQSISATVTELATVKCSLVSGYNRLYQARQSSSESQPLPKTLKPHVDVIPQGSMALGALNLSKSRSESETQGRLTVLPSPLLSSITSTGTSSVRPHRFQVSSAASSSISLPSLFKNSQHNSPILVNQLPLTVTQSNKDRGVIRSGGSTTTAKVIPFTPSIGSVSPSISTAPTSTLPGPQSISSPSLAAILRQPPNPRLNQDSAGHRNVNLSSSSTSSSEVISAWVASPNGREQVQIKCEPIDPGPDAIETTFNSLPCTVIKSEVCETSNTDFNKVYTSKDAVSPRNIVVDMCDPSDSLRTAGVFRVRSPVRPAIVKCEFCSQILMSPRDSINHVCPGPKS